MRTLHPTLSSRSGLLFGVTLISIAALACSDDGGTGTSGAGGDASTSQGSGGDATTSQGGGTAQGTGGATTGSGGAGGGAETPLFEGTIWIESSLAVGGTAEAAAFGLFWEPGSAMGAMDEWYDKFIGSGMPLAVGDCALVTQGAAPAYTPLSVGPTAYVRSGSTDLIELLLYTSDTDYYGDAGATEAAALKSAAFTFEIDPGTGPIGALASPNLGPIVGITPPTNPSCATTSDCDLVAAPSAAVDDLFFLFNLTYVCRGDATTGAFTLTTEVLASDGDAIGSVQSYAIDRQTVPFGASTVEMLLLNRTGFNVALQ